MLISFIYGDKRAAATTRLPLLKISKSARANSEPGKRHTLLCLNDEFSEASSSISEISLFPIDNFDATDGFHFTFSRPNVQDDSSFA